jgi:hypothetical protein
MKNLEDKLRNKSYYRTLKDLKEKVNLQPYWYIDKYTFIQVCWHIEEQIEDQIYIYIDKKKL